MKGVRVIGTRYIRHIAAKTAVGDLLDLFRSGHMVFVLLQLLTKTIESNSDNLSFKMFLQHPDVTEFTHGKGFR